MRYGYGALMINQFSGPMGDPMFIEGETVLQHYQLKDYTDHSSAHYSWYRKTVDMWANVGFLVLFFFGFFMCALLALKYKTHGAR